MPSARQEAPHNTHIHRQPQCPGTAQTEYLSAGDFGLPSLLDVLTLAREARPLGLSSSLGPGASSSVHSSLTSEGEGSEQMMRFSTSHLTASCAFFLFPSSGCRERWDSKPVSCPRKQGGRKESRRGASVSRALGQARIFPDRGLLCLSF